MSTAMTEAIRCVCKDCCAEHLVEDAILARFTVRCPPCQERFDAQMKADEAAALLKRRDMEWRDLVNFYQCGSFMEHQHYWITKLGLDIKRAAERWCDHHLRELDKGLGLIGVPGVGKTVAAGRCIRWAHRRGYSVAITSDPRLHTLADALHSDADTKSRAQQELRLLAGAELLMIDDVGQSCVSGAARDLLFKLVHDRHMAGRHLIWTAQAGFNWLAIRMGAAFKEDGSAVPSEELAAFLRRIHEPFCRVEVVKAAAASSENIL